VLEILRQRLPEVLRSLAPLLGVVCVLQLAVIGAPAAQFLQFLAGTALVALGMLLLLAGIDLGILPMGRFIGAELPRRGSALFIAGTAFALGFTTTAAEPDVLILAAQVEAASQGAWPAQPLTWLIAAGVGACAALALLRILFGFSLRGLLAAAYALVLALSLAAPAGILPLAFDAGSVTTGVLSAPVLLALSLGLASVLAGRTPASDGFGLLGLASLGPVLALLLLGLLPR
jgi:hypothetical protein